MGHKLCLKFLPIGQLRKKSNMAKLNANGRSELARMSKETECINEDSSVSWRKIIYVFMSDNSILENIEVKFLPDEYFLGKTRSRGWKMYKKLSNLDEFIELGKLKGCS
jgi:hypothetical protein